ncbi:PIG-L deacetylase family protein [Thermoanaerobacterium thermosaccharolyticum]|uniref:Putative LmbE-like protein n=1 Tax=Thermoanaerobacterium thermosaccharolyticum M0795 TaxID=698948 RepID=L0IJW0_THETR|nr:PIG-L family deacetylase [Thermoanaerobacterium thermosaccharolyticum]AGB18257.1 putative LmbE-like protein [Thermoanaerobacterium thermosaccharolyticum M0795]
MKKKKFFIAFIIILALLVSYVMNLKTTFANLTEKKPEPEFDNPGQRILVIVPHPDDESLGMAGVIQRAVSQNIPIKVVIVTNGDSYKKAAAVYTGHVNPTPADFYKLGIQRQSESIAAMSELGLPKSDVIFLGFADGSTRFLWSDFWDNARPRVSGGTQAAYSPYKNVYKPGIAYTGSNLENSIQEIIKSFNPTDIYYPLADDIHPDHWAVSNFVRYAITAMNLNVRQHMFLVHHPQWPVPWLLEPSKPLLPPVDMADSNTKWQIFKLRSSEIQKKELAIRKYKTQIAVMEPFLMGFIRENELFGTKPVLIIPNVEALPDFKQQGLPYTLIKIPAGGILNQEIYRSADLTELAAFYYKDHELYIGMQSLAPFSKDVTYQLDMRLFYKNSIRRIDLGLVGKRIYEYKKAENSFSYIPISKPIFNKNKIWIRINIPDTNNLNYIFMGADSIYKNRLIDKIPWNMYKLEKK